MDRRWRSTLTGLVCAALGVASPASRTAGATTAVPNGGWTQTEEDAYTRYELGAPGSGTFRIVYDVTATTAGADLYFNPIRRGSEPTVHGVRDLATGESLEWKLVSVEDAAADGLRGTDHDGLFLRVALPRTVPTEGGVRLRIDKTYEDAASYGVEDDRLVFERTLGVRRNAVVLPPGFELTACDHPSQVVLEPDGRIRASFLNLGAAPVPYRLVGRRLPSAPAPAPAADGAIAERPAISVVEPASARLDYRVSERAAEDREIVYFLSRPETHSFFLYHDYTETRTGVDRYVNLVRPGSRASEPAARSLDSGESLRVETLRGMEIGERGIELDGEPVTDETEIVVIWFEPVAAGESRRLRIAETYTDPGRYGLDGDELLWDRTLGRSRNMVVLPDGWWLTASSMPAVVDLTEDGRVRLRLDNDRPDALQVLLRARRRATDPDPS
jgi:hypothetical protein